MLHLPPWKKLVYLFLLFSPGNVISQDRENILIENEVLRIEIKPLGAELQSIKHNHTGQEYLWQGDTAYWKDRSPIMFPVNVRFKDNLFTYKGKSYKMPRMGLAVSEKFKVLPTNRQEQIALEFRSTENTLVNYPFPFNLVVTYRLDSHQLVNEFHVENLGVDTLYFALGGHPGFRFPDDTKNRSDFAYTFAKKMKTSRIEIAESLVQRNLIPFLNNENNLGLDDSRIPANGSGMFVKNIACNRIGLGEKGKSPFVEIDLGDFPNVNLWSPPGSPYACIEPMIAHHDLVDSPPEIKEKSFLIKLPPLQSKRYSYTIICN